MSTGSDASVPNMARVYDYWLGGKDHYAADREEAERLLRIYPPLCDLIRENRAFLVQAITWTAGQGIGQLLDLGAGLPTLQNTHEVARAVNPTARVAYIDTDPVVLSHAQALLATNDGVAAVAADLRDAAVVLADPEVLSVIDPTRPMTVIFGAVLHFLDAAIARQVTTGYTHLLAPGSFLVISLAHYDNDTLGKQLSADYTAGQFINHSRVDIMSFFAGWELVGPGLAEAGTWRAWMSEPVLSHREGHVLGGVACNRV